MRIPESFGRSIYLCISSQHQLAGAILDLKETCSSNTSMPECQRLCVKCLVAIDIICG